MLRHVFLHILLVFSSITTVLSFLPTFSPENKQICDGFGFNWAAEIRCLREVINQCLLNQDGVAERSRGGRSLHQAPPPDVAAVAAATSSDYGSPYSYPRPYKNHYYRNSISPIRPPIPQPIPVVAASSCKCEGLEKMESKFEKKLYEVKMKAEYDTVKGISDLKQRFEIEMREFQRQATKDISEMKRMIDYIQAPRVVNNDVEYFFIQKEESWYTASEKCIGYGAHLASVHTRLENGLVTSLIPVNQTAWIGVNDIQKENVFKNSDLTVVDYFRWGAKQPNNEEHNENCVEVDQTGYWNDKLCIITRPFVCKKRVEK